MKNILTATTFAAIVSIASLAANTSLAQTADPKQEWARKVVALQQGPELDRLVEQLAASTTQELLQNWGPKVQAIPEARQAQVKDELNAELKRYTSDVAGAIASKVAKVSADSLVPAYMERFTLDELKQIAAFFESPAIKKYQSSAPELGGVFIEKLVESTRADVSARADQFNNTAAKIIGSTPSSKPSPSPASKDKPAVKR
jgi:hypothetical protein